MLDSGTLPIRSRTPATTSATDAPEGCACRVARTASRTSPGGLRCRFSGMAEVETSGRHVSNPVPCDMQMAVPATARTSTARPRRRDLAERSDGSSRETVYRKPPREVSAKGGVGKTRRQCRAGPPPTGKPTRHLTVTLREMSAPLGSSAGRTTRLRRRTVGIVQDKHHERHYHLPLLRFDPIPLAVARREAGPGERKGKGDATKPRRTAETFLLGTEVEGGTASVLRRAREGRRHGVLPGPPRLRFAP